MINGRIDSRVFRRKIRDAVRASPEARRAGLVLMGRSVANVIVRHSPRDTQRFVRSFVMAGNEAGVLTMPLPKLVPSRYLADHQNRLLRQYRKLVGFLVTWYGDVHFPTRRKPDRWFHRLREAMLKAERQLAEMTETAILIGGRRSGVLSRLATVRREEHGGTGRWLDYAGRTYLELRSLEPHAAIVESRTRVVSTAISNLRGFGLMRAGDAYIAKVARAAQLADFIGGLAA